MSDPAFQLLGPVDVADRAGSADRDHEIGQGREELSVLGLVQGRESTLDVRLGA